MLHPFTPHVDLFATRLNHKLPTCVSSPRSKCLGHRCSKHKWSGLTAYAYLPTVLLHKVIQNQAVLLPGHCNSPRLARDALVLGPSTALYRDPTSASSVNYSSQTVSQLCASQQATTSQPQRLVSRSGQHQEQGFSVEVVEIIAAPQGLQQRPSSTQSGPYLRNGVEKIWWTSPLPLWNNSRPLTVTLLTPWAQLKLRP